MPTFFAGVAGYAVFLTLIAAAVEHASRRQALPIALRAHRVVPGAAFAGLAIAAPVLEGALGIAGLIALVRSDRTVLLLALAGAAVLLLLYAAYGGFVRSTGRSGPCGCSRVDVPMSRWVVIRATALAALALVGLTGADAATRLTDDPGALTVVLLAATTFATLLWHLPAALHEPTAGGVPTWTS